MAHKSSDKSYGSVAVTIHWLSVLLIIALLGFGFSAGQTIDPEIKTKLLQVHATLGLTILFLTLARMVWWWRFDVKPKALEGSIRWQKSVAKAIHFLFYVTIIGMVASGIGMFVLSGAGPIIFSGAEGALPDFNAYPPRVPHGIGARAILLLFIIHAGAALYHHFVRRDVTLKRIWYGSGASK